MILSYHHNALANRFRDISPSRRILPRSTVLLFAAFVFVSHVCEIESQAQEQEEVSLARVVVGNDKTGPGGDAFVPIVFSSATAESVGTVIVEIRFPEKDLVFREIKSADSEKTNVSAAAENDPKEPGKTLLRVQVESKAGALASGVLGNLIFKVSDSVTFGEKIPLPQVAQGLSGGPSPKPVNLATVDGQIDVSAVPGVFSCFFYMH